MEFLCLVILYKNIYYIHMGVLGFWGAPASRISFMARAPSAPMPVSVAPTALRPATRAADWNSTSTDGLWRLTSSPSAPRQCSWRRSAPPISAVRRGDVGVSGARCLHRRWPPSPQCGRAGLARAA